MNGVYRAKRGIAHLRVLTREQARPGVLFELRKANGALVDDDAEERKLELCAAVFRYASTIQGDLAEENVSKVVDSGGSTTSAFSIRYLSWTKDVAQSEEVLQKTSATKFISVNKGIIARCTPTHSRFAFHRRGG